MADKKLTRYPTLDSVVKELRKRLDKKVGSRLTAQHAMSFLCSYEFKYDDKVIYTFNLRNHYSMYDLIGLEPKEAARIEEELIGIMLYRIKTSLGIKTS